MPLPPDFDAALAALGRAAIRHRIASGTRAVVVGGAAVALYTDGSVMSGDFDIVVVSGTDDLFGDAMLAEGFLRENRAGHLLVGWHHPAHPRYGFQLVTGPLFDGRSDPARLLEVETGPGGAVHFASVEDVVADRLGQHAAARSPTDLSMLEQARIMAAVAPRLDRGYMRRRVLEEGGDPALLGLDIEEPRP